jgi:hypothetical protein
MFDLGGTCSTNKKKCAINFTPKSSEQRRHFEELETAILKRRRKQKCAQNFSPKI